MLDNKGTPMKATAVTLCTLVVLFVLHQVFLIAVEETAFYRWQSAVLHWRYLHQAVFCLILPVAALLVLKREPRLYAIGWNRGVFTAMACVLALTLVVPLAVDALTGNLRPRGDAGYLLSTLVFQIVFSGIGEELYCRGMVQGEVDRVAGKPFRIGSTRFGLGLFVAALYFGLGHLGLSAALNGGELHLVSFGYTTALGLLLGYLRAHTANVFIVGAVHGGLDTYSYLVVPGYGTFVHFVAVGVVMYLLFSGILYKPAPGAKPLSRSKNARVGQ